MHLRTTFQRPQALSLDNSFQRKLRWFLAPPVTTLVLLLVSAIFVQGNYQRAHDQRIYTGVRVAGTDLSKMTRSEAATTLANILPQTASTSITLVEPETGHVWVYSAEEMGMRYDLERTIDVAFDAGREGGALAAVKGQFESWYYGRELLPVAVLDEGKLEQVLGEVAAEIDRPAVDAQVALTAEGVNYSAGQVGRQLDVAEAKARLVAPLVALQQAEVKLLVHEVRPHVLDDPETARRLRMMVGTPMTFYFPEPLFDGDLERIEVPTTQLAQWLRVRMVEDEVGARYDAFIDENAVRSWLNQMEAQVYRQPQNARFYFDDNTQELVLVEPHVNGRSLNVEATLKAFMGQVDTSDRSVPFVVDDVIPTVHSQAEAAELGITELITQSTTWFYGSTPERKHNIARAAAQFFGVVVAPGEEFSFNRYLGDVTEEAGFSTGLIILGGRTVEGVGGGVCQVSTTMYQAAFWAGFPVTERLEHGYRVHYYDDGEGPGMDATVFTPLVDLKFVNNTEHYLLIENYYDETSESLTFKFYSTRTGRTVEKEGPFFENVVPPKPDVWEYNEELEPGEIIQVDWAVEGADVTVYRRVYDADGNLMYGNEAFVSNYIPWSNVYQYGPGVDPENVDPADIPEE